VVTAVAGTAVVGAWTLGALDRPTGPGATTSPSTSAAPSSQPASSAPDQFLAGWDLEDIPWWWRLLGYLLWFGVLIEILYLVAPQALERGWRNNKKALEYFTGRASTEAERARDGRRDPRRGVTGEAGGGGEDLMKIV